MDNRMKNSMKNRLLWAGFSALLLASCALPEASLGTDGVGRALSGNAKALVNGIQWADTSTNPINAHGGGIVQSGGYYYWFGENRKADNTFAGVSCYRSTDLSNWEFRGNVLSSTSATELNVANIERPKVVYNASTGQFVMWMHYEDPAVGYGLARAAVAVGSTIDGAYTYQGSFRPFQGQGITDHGRDGYMSRDCNLFVDTDGSGYFVSASNENADLMLYKLTADYRGIASLTAKLFAGGSREAPVLFKRNGVYVLLTSAATGWAPNQGKYATSTSLASGWSSLTSFGDSTTYHSQPTTVVAVGSTYLYLGDRWAGAWSGKVNDSPYVVLPLTFASNTSLSMAWKNTVVVDAAAGTVSSATNNFAFTNQNSGKVLEVINNATTDSAAIDQYTGNSGTNQKWSLTYDNAGAFALTNKNSAKVIDVPSASTADGKALIQYTANGGTNQQWWITDLGAGKYRLTNKNSGKVMQVRGASTANAAVVEQSTATGSTNQVWLMSLSN